MTRSEITIPDSPWSLVYTPLFQSLRRGLYRKDRKDFAKGVKALDRITRFSGCSVGGEGEVSCHRDN